MKGYELEGGKGKLDLNKVKTPVVITLVLLALFAGIFFLGPGMSGLFVAEPGLVSYKENISITAVGDKTEIWNIAEYPEAFDLRTVQFSGDYIGNGTAKVWLENEQGQRFLIFDNSELVPESLVDITGRVVAVNTSEGEEELEVTFTAEEENVTEEVIENVTEEIIEEANVSEKIIEEINVTEEAVENVTEELNITEEINETIEIIENITQEITEKEVTESLSYNSGTNFDSDNDGIEDIDGAIDFTVADTEFTWDVDKSKLCTRWQIYPVGTDEATILCYGAQDCCNFVGLEPYMPVWDVPFALVYGGHGSSYNNQISAQVIYADLDTADIYYSSWAELSARFTSEGSITFEDICAETCVLPSGLSSTSYNLVFEVGSGILSIDEISYVVKNMSYEIEEFEFNPEIMNAKNELVEYDIEFEEVHTKKIKKTEQIRKPKVKGLVIAPKLKVKEGRYNIKVKPKNHPIESIVVHDMDISSNITDFIDIDDVPEFGDYVEVYAIDPTAINFTNATVTVTAKGTQLYKCKDWNFTTQNCYGTWTKLMDITPGQEYAFTLTPEDPGFAETITSCVAEDNAAKGSFGGSCDNTTGAYLENNEGTVETHAAGKSQYAGVKIESVDTGITNCDNVTKVEICYEWWRAGTYEVTDCDISVDADGGASFTAVNTTCPGTSANPGVTCTDVTSSESWNCTHFFGASGTRAQAKSEISRTAAGAGGDEIVSWDVLYFNVTYSQNILPVVTLDQPPVSYTNSTSQFVNLTFNASVTDDINLANCSLWHNISSTWSLNQTQNVTGTTNSTTFNLTQLTNTTFLWNIECYDNESNSSFASANRTVILNWGTVNLAPTHTTPVLNSTLGTNLSTENLTCYNQSTADANGGSVKNIYNWYKNGTSIMILNYPFEGGSNSTYTKDYSGYGNDGTVTGATWNSTGGYDGKGAYEFDGIDDNITISDNPTIEGMPEITTLGWVKMNQLPTQYYHPFGKESTYRIIIGSAGEVHFVVATTNNSWYTAGTQADCAGTISAGTWHHITGIYNGTHTLCYVNSANQGVGASAISGNLTTNDFPFTIGAKTYDNIDHFNGTIDDVMVFNYSLSQEQILALYQNRTDLIVSQETSVGDIWRCDVTPSDGDLTGTTLSSNNLTIVPPDTTPPNSVTNLGSPFNGSTWIYWNWTNPDTDFSKAIIYIDSVWKLNTSNNYYNATGLSADTNYTITVHTKDDTGNVNDTDVNSTALTLTATPENLTIDSLAITPDDDGVTPGAQINPLEASNLTITLIANITNASSIDTCEVRIWNESGTYASPTLSIVTGTIQTIGTQVQCNATWKKDYWRNYGDWNLSVDVNLTDGTADQSNSSYYYNVLTSHSINVSYINFSSGVPGQTMNSTTAYPLEIKNTGNKPINISISGTDFVGVQDNSYNFSIGNATYNETATGTFTSITTTYVKIGGLDNIAPTSTAYLYFRGTIPVGTKSQEYQNTISIKSD